MRRSFLSKSQTFALRRLAENEMYQDVGTAESGSKSSADIAGGEELCVLNVSDMEPDGEPEWTAVEDFVHQATTWGGGESHDQSKQGLPPVYVTRWETWRHDGALNRSGPLHLDARLHPERRRTVLAYLTGTGDFKKDGGTVFPCLETDDMDTKEAARRQKLCSRAARHLQHAHEKLLALRAKGLELPPSKQYDFLEEHPELAGLPAENAEGIRPVNWLWLPGFDGLAAEAPGKLRAEPLHLLAEAICRGKAPGFRVSSRDGDALLMDVLEPMDESTSMTEQKVPKVDWRLWHAGCSPVDGSGFRITAQIFLHDVHSLRAPNAQACEECKGSCRSASAASACKAANQ